jgi:cytochrome b561
MTKPLGYSRAQIRLHWIIAALIVAQVVFGENIGEAYEQIKRGNVVAFDPLVMSHVAGGMLIFALGVWRLVLRRKRGVPAPVAGQPRAQVLAAEAVHYLLYAIMILAPITGGLAWFGGIEQAGDAHEMVKPVIVGLVAVHVLAALYHQFIKKDGLLMRMKQPLD